jgi:hypothetical protein
LFIKIPFLEKTGTLRLIRQEPDFRKKLCDNQAEMRHRRSKKPGIPGFSKEKAGPEARLSLFRDPSAAKAQ